MRQGVELVTAVLPSLDSKKRPDDLTTTMWGFKFLWQRNEKVVDGMTVPAEEIWSRGIRFFTHNLALERYPALTKQMGS